MAVRTREKALICGMDSLGSPRAVRRLGGRGSRRSAREVQCQARRAAADLYIQRWSSLETKRPCESSAASLASLRATRSTSSSRDGYFQVTMSSPATSRSTRAMPSAELELIREWPDIAKL